MTSTQSLKNGFVIEDIKMDGKVALITGSNRGIGFEAALDFAKRGAKVLLACRDVEKGDEAKRKILEEAPNSVVLVKKLDLASLESVRECANDVIETEERLDVLVNNAGVVLTPKRLTKDGFELMLEVNHIGHFLLNNMLLDLLKKSAPSRIVSVSALVYSFAEMKWGDLKTGNENFDAVTSYFNSRLAQALYCYELSKRLAGTGVTCNFLHPGVIATNWTSTLGDMSHISFFWRMFFRFIALPFARFSGVPVREGAQTLIYVAIAPELETVSGKLFNKYTEQNLHPIAQRQSDAEKLWKLSEEWAEIKENNIAQKEGTLEEKEKDCAQEEKQQDGAQEEVQQDGTQEKEQQDGTQEEKQQDGAQEEEQQDGTQEEEQQDGAREEEQQDGTQEEEQQDGTPKEEVESA